jgi:hypothetical protein
VLEEHVKKLGADLELPSFSVKNQENLFHLSFGGRLELSIRSLKPGLFLIAKVAPLPLQKREESFMYFMQGNLLGQGTGKQELGIDDEENFLTLSRKIPYEVNYIEFKDAIEDFVNFLDYWQKESERLQKEADASIL